MILFIERIGGDKSREHFRLNTPADFEALFEEYPQTKPIAMFSESMDKAAEEIARYLSSHHMNAWIEKDGLAKGIRDMALGMGMAAAAAVAPAHALAQHPAPQPSPVASTAAQPASDFGTHPEDKFLWTIAEVESQNGKNTNHRPIVHGPYKGNTAIGRWGMLRPTIMEMLNRMKQHGPVDPEVGKLETMSRDQIAKEFQAHPDKELGLARYIAKHVLHRQRGNKLKSAYAWTMGHNLFPREIPDEGLDGHFYVEMYKKFDKKNPFRLQHKKALRPQLAQATPMHKSEDKEQFKNRLTKWKGIRDTVARERLEDDHSHSYDPGRIRDDKEIEGPKNNNDRVQRVLKQVADAQKPLKP